MSDLPWWVRATLASSVMALLAGALIVSTLQDDHNNLNIIIGAIIAQFATVVGYYFGSSQGSQLKDAAIMQQSAALANHSEVVKNNIPKP